MNLMAKTVDTWTMTAEELFTKLGLPLPEGNKTGSCIMPAPKHLQSVKQQQDAQNQEAEGSKEGKQNG